MPLLVCVLNYPLCLYVMICVFRVYLHVFVVLQEEYTRVHGDGNKHVWAACMEVMPLHLDGDDML